MVKIEFRQRSAIATNDASLYVSLPIEWTRGRVAKGDKVRVYLDDDGETLLLRAGVQR